MLPLLCAWSSSLKDAKRVRCDHRFGGVNLGVRQQPTAKRGGASFTVLMRSKSALSIETSVISTIGGLENALWVHYVRLASNDVMRSWATVGHRVVGWTLLSFQPAASEKKAAGGRQCPW